MCVGENCAPQAVHYMNAQLAALYDNARACLDDHHVTEKKPEETRYSHALAEYKYFDGHKDEPKFSASFDKPWVEFICNHDVILHLKIREGHYRLDYHKAPITYSKQDIVQPLEEVELSFRVRFDIQGLRGKDAKISSQDNLIQLVILNLTKAQLIASEPAIIIGRDAFVHYMEHYLCFLHQAGNHVLFSLPDFDDDKYRLTIDFSLMKSHVPDVHELHGISIDKINEYLLSVWLKAAMLMDGAHGKVHDWKQTCLAEYRSTWSHHGDGDNHFRVRLGAPRIKAICSREVVLYFTIEEVHFYDSADFEKEPCHSYSNWEIAVLVDVIYEKTHDGHVTTCKLDLSTARSYHSQCNFGDIVASDETVLSYCTRMLTFFTEAYLDILESIELHVIYRFDARWLSPVHADDGSEDEDEPSHGEWETVPKPGTTRGGWASTVTQSEMYGFDQITAISQSSVNAHFRALWEVRHSVLATWKFEQYFQAEFEPVTIRLLSHERAIVSIRIQHGFLKPLKGGKLHADHAERHFDNWHLVFEVGIKRTKHSELNVSDGWRQKFKESLIFKEHGHDKNRQLEHIYLDFQHAEFLYDFSTFEGLFNKGKHTHGAIDNVLAARHYVEKQYLPHLVHSGLHIIHTVPVWTSGPADSLPSCALTSFTFHVYSKTEITRHSWAHGALEPVIIVLGMTKYRELPSMHLEYSANWDIRVTKGVSHGTVCVSRSAFMETRLLRLLEQVNSLTTVVPKFYGVHDGDWVLDLTTWALHDWRRNLDCKWVPVGGDSSVVKYKWQHRDCWNYEHEGSGEVANGTYSVYCFTRNYVELPTAIRNKPLDIKVWGEIDLEMSYKSGTHHGSAKSKATWSTVLCVQTDMDGVKVTVGAQPIVEIEKTSHEGNTISAKFPDLRAALEAQLPKVVDFNAILKELRTFEGVWRYGYHGTQGYCLANPVFTLHGDLLFELRPHGQQVVRPKPLSASLHQVSMSGGRAPSIIRSDSFFIRAKSAIKSVLQDNANGQSLTLTNGNGQVSTNGNGKASAKGNGGAHNSPTGNGNKRRVSGHKDVVYSEKTMQLDVKTVLAEKSTVQVEEEVEVSFLVPKVAMA